MAQQHLRDRRSWQVGKRVSPSSQPDTKTSAGEHRPDPAIVLLACAIRMPASCMPLPTRWILLAGPLSAVHQCCRRVGCRAGFVGTIVFRIRTRNPTFSSGNLVEAMGLEPTNLLTASQALYQLSYAPSGGD
jgi:hypothetical protein